jgi:hypothetical protein
MGIMKKTTSTYQIKPFKPFKRLPVIQHLWYRDFPPSKEVDLSYKPSGQFRCSKFTFDKKASSCLTLVQVFVDGKPQLTTECSSIEALSGLGKIWGSLDTCKKQLLVKMRNFSTKSKVCTIFLEGAEVYEK